MAMAASDGARARRGGTAGGRARVPVRGAGGWARRVAESGGGGGRGLWLGGGMSGVGTAGEEDGV